MKPHDFYFDTQKKDEQVLRVIHRHWFDILKQYFPVLGILIAMGASFAVLPYLFTDFTTHGSISVFFFFQTFFLLALWLYGFLVWTDYYLDIWIITNERVVNVEQRGLFVRHVSELKFSQVQDVSTEVEGLIPTFLNYGHVHTQTAAEQTRFSFRSVPNPYRIKAMLMRLHQESQKKESSKTHTLSTPS